MFDFCAQFRGIVKNGLGGQFVALLCDVFPAAYNALVTVVHVEHYRVALKPGNIYAGSKDNASVAVKRLIRYGEFVVCHILRVIMIYGSKLYPIVETS